MDITWLTDDQLQLTNTPLGTCHVHVGQRWALRHLHLTWTLDTTITPDQIREGGPGTTELADGDKTGRWRVQSDAASKLIVDVAGQRLGGAHHRHEGWGENPRITKNTNATQEPDTNARRTIHEHLFTMWRTFITSAPVTRNLLRPLGTLLADPTQTVQALCRHRDMLDCHIEVMASTGGGWAESGEERDRIVRSLDQDRATITRMIETAINQIV